MNFNITRNILKPEKKHLIKTCDACNGSGVEIRIQQFGPMIQQVQANCSKCGGQGKIIPDGCLDSVKEKFSINIEKGMCNDEQIILKKNVVLILILWTIMILYLLLLKRNIKYLRE